MSKQRMLVTGAAGFIGSHQCRRLVAVGIEDGLRLTVDWLKEHP